MCFKVFLLFLFYCSAAQSSWTDLNCDKCPVLLGKLGAMVKNALSTIELASYDVCPFNPSTEKACFETRDVTLSVIEKINVRLFPSSFKHSINHTLVCSHFFGICADHDSDGKKLKEYEWSCDSCSTFFEMILNVFNAPLESINSAAATFFCGEQTECRSAFKEVIEVSGVLGKLLKKKKPIDEVCRAIMLCKG